jgi:hypothetical protein
MKPPCSQHCLNPECGFTSTTVLRPRFKCCPFCGGPLKLVTSTLAPPILSAAQSPEYILDVDPRNGGNLDGKSLPKRPLSRTLNGGADCTQDARLQAR